MEDPYALKIYTDGSALDNPGKRCGWGMVIVYPEHFNIQAEEVFSSIDSSTINRMELSAVIEAIREANVRCKKHLINRAIILSDSLYVANNYTSVVIWRSNNWCNKEGRPIENADLWKKFLSVRNSSQVRIEIKWIKGKTTEETKKVDQLAKVAARSGIRKRDYGFVGGKVSRSKEKGSATMYEGGAGEKTIRVYRYKAIRPKLLQVRFEILDSSNNTKRGEKYFAYYSPLREIEISRQGVYRVIFSNDTKFPQFIIVS